MTELPITNMSNHIPLTKGLFVIVDEADHAWLSQWKWYARTGRKDYVYASRSIRNGKTTTIINMHNILLPTEDGYELDHINGNTLDNRRDNLRVATHQQNMWNRKPPRGTSSKFKGVSFQKATNYWKANIKINDKQKHLGCFWDEEEAAIAYNRAAKDMHGEFAKLNPVEDRPCLSQILR